MPDRRSKQKQISFSLIGNCANDCKMMGGDRGRFYYQHEDANKLQHNNRRLACFECFLDRKSVVSLPRGVVVLIPWTLL
jgi:hypothetical protein